MISVLEKTRNAVFDTGLEDGFTGFPDLQKKRDKNEIWT